jgi:hypothetical protein
MSTIWKSAGLEEFRVNIGGPFSCGRRLNPLTKSTFRRLELRAKIVTFSTGF